MNNKVGRDSRRAASLSRANPGSRGRSPARFEILLPVRDYDLAATLDSGQVFRWQPERGAARPHESKIETRGRAARAPTFVDRRCREKLCPAHANARRRASALKPPRRSTTGNGSAIFSKPKPIWPPCSKLFPTTSRCAQPSPRAAACACCGRSRGNVSRRSFCPRPNKSSKSGKLFHCSAKVLVNRCSGSAGGLAGVPQFLESQNSPAGRQSAPGRQSVVLFISNRRTPRRID